MLACQGGLIKLLTHWISTFWKFTASGCDPCTLKVSATSFNNIPKLQNNVTARQGFPPKYFRQSCPSSSNVLEPFKTVTFFFFSNGVVGESVSWLNWTSILGSALAIGLERKKIAWPAYYLRFWWRRWNENECLALVHPFVHWYFNGGWWSRWVMRESVRVFFFFFRFEHVFSN